MFLSGTPTPESYSQMYHQVYGVAGNPFYKYKNFYAFAKTYVNVTQRKINSMMINDYSKGNAVIVAGDWNMVHEDRDDQVTFYNFL